MKPARSLYLCGVAAVSVVFGGCAKKAGSEANASREETPLSERVNQAATEARQTAAEWSARLGVAAADFQVKAGELLTAAKNGTAHLGDNAKQKMDELAALMPEIQAEAAQLKQNSGEAAKAAGERLHNLMARAEALYLDLTGGNSPPAKPPTTSTTPR